MWSMHPHKEEDNVIYAPSQRMGPIRGKRPLMGWAHGVASTAQVAFEPSRLQQ